MHKGEIDIFIPCIVDQVFPQIGWDMVALLEHLGFKVNYNPNQTCCGAPSFFNGLKETTREVATKFLEDFHVNTKIVGPSPNCVAMVNIHYDQFFRNTSNHNVYRNLQGRMHEFTNFICEELGDLTVKKITDKKVFYWGSCSGQNDCGIGGKAIDLLKQRNVQLLNDANLPICCGNTGAMGSLHEDIAIERLEKSLEQIQALNPEIIVFDEPACQLHVDGYLKKIGSPIESQHITQVLKEMYVN